MIDRREVLKFGSILGVGAALPSLISTASASSKSSSFNWKLQPPEAAGMTGAGIAASRAAIQKNIDAKVISGAVTAVARHNKLVMFEAHGWADVDGEKPMRPDSLFRLASSSKVITSVAVLMMVDEGKLALEDPVSKFIPTFRGQKVDISPASNADPAKTQLVPATRDITVQDLLTHTAGLASIYRLGGFKVLPRKPGDALKTVIPQLGALPLDFQPGAFWRYSPLEGMDVLLYLVELVSGTPADTFLQERIFEPLEMQNTYFMVPANRKDRLVKIYGVRENKFESKPWMFPEDNVTYFSGAGGLISCAHDMLNFELMLLNRGSFDGRRLLKPETVALMSRNHVGRLFAESVPKLAGGDGFGLGVGVVEDEATGGGRAAGAFGWRGAYGTDTWADPKLDMACVVLIQMDPGPVAPVQQFGQALRQAIVT
jgi:CubicO group peptidase (beta-lactamase class C family)